MIVFLSLIGATILPIIGHLAVGLFFGWHTLGIVVGIQIVFGIIFGE